MNPVKWLVCWWHGKHIPVTVGWHWRKSEKICIRCGVKC